MHKPSICFYYPRMCDEHDVPECNGQYKQRRSGNYIWTVKTYGYLKKAGFQCCLETTFPTKGIVLTHRDFLSSEVRPGKSQLLVCIVADTYRHPYAQIHIVQNPSDPLVNQADHIWPSYFIPHWTESGLVSRDPSRGERFENISYFGSNFNLAPQLHNKGWKNKLQEIGFQWMTKEPNSWNDYSDTDVVVAVRSFTELPYYKTPATKLYNAWAAGVPAILGYESACRAEKRSPLDYIEVKNKRDIVAALIRLREDKEYRRAIIENGRVRAKEVLPEKTVEKWMSLLLQIVVPAYHDWCEKSIEEKQSFFRKRFLSYLSFKVKGYFNCIYRNSASLIAALK